MEEVNEKIRSLRRAKNLTLEQVAEALGMTKGGYHSLERGRTEFSLSRLFKLAKVLDVSMSELLSLQENEKETQQVIQLKKQITELQTRIADLEDRLRDKERIIRLFESRQG